MRIDSGFDKPFDFAAVGARQPTSRARVLEVRIQSPPPGSLRTIGSSAPVFHRAPAAVAPMIVGHDVIFRGAGGRKSVGRKTADVFMDATWPRQVNHCLSSM